MLKSRTFFYIRDETYADALSPEVAFRFVEEEESILEQLQRFKESIRLLPSQLTTCDYRQPATAVRQAKQDLITYAEKSFLPLGDGFERRRERQVHTAFALHRRAPWSGSPSDEAFEVIDEFLNPRNQVLTPLVICGGAGEGKTALISNYVAASRHKLPHGACPLLLLAFEKHVPFLLHPRTPQQGQGSSARALLFPRDAGKASCSSHAAFCTHHRFVHRSISRQ